jgi:adenine-specific DNA-methyltransferase
VFDLCYVDPPYNQHQYGSNYHLLNTIALWDDPPIDNMLDETGGLCRRAGIRPDWKKTRSGFCSAVKAREEFAALMEASEGRLMAVSYSTDGLVPVEELFALFERYGRTSIFTSDYTVYRGGRQSPTKAGKNLELLFVIDRSSRAPTGGEGRAELLRVLGIRKAGRLLRESFVPARILEFFPVTGETVELAPELHLKSDRLYRFPTPPEKGTLEALSADTLESLTEKLEESRCTDRQEECAVLRGLIAAPSSSQKRDETRLLTALRTLVHRKYAGIWEEELRKSRILAESDPRRFTRLAEGLSKLEELASLRFSG